MEGLAARAGDLEDLKNIKDDKQREKKLAAMLEEIQQDLED